MLNYSDFINKEVINACNERGVVTSFNNNNIVIAYPNESKTYVQALAFKMHFLRFTDESLNTLIKENLATLQSEEKKNEDDLNKVDEDYKNRAEVINRRYASLKKKQYMLRQLFGGDFNYPPLKEFKEKYKHVIVDQDKLWIRKISNYKSKTRPGHTYWYWYF